MTRALVGIAVLTLAAASGCIRRVRTTPPPPPASSTSQTGSAEQGQTGTPAQPQTAPSGKRRPTAADVSDPSTQQP